MSSMVNAFSGTIQQLAEDTGELLRTIVSYNNNLSTKLDNLGNSFTDEGIDIIKKHIDKTRNQISDALPEFGVFLGKLTEYAGYLEKSQKVLGGGSVQQEGMLHTKSRSPEWVKSHNGPEWTIYPDGSKIYGGSPLKTVVMLQLNWYQGNADNKYKQDCMLASAENMLRISGGNDIDEGRIIKHCEEVKDVYNGTGKELCDMNLPDGDNGGSRPEHIVEILRHFGLPCKLEEQNIENIEKAIVSGKALMIVTSSRKLWGEGPGGKHAVTVISVEQDAEGNLTHFYVVDSGYGRAPTKYTKKQIEDSLTKDKMIVTKKRRRFFNNEHNI